MHKISENQKSIGQKLIFPASGTLTSSRLAFKLVDSTPTPSLGQPSSVLWLKLKIQMKSKLFQKTFFNQAYFICLWRCATFIKIKYLSNCEASNKFNVSKLIDIHFIFLSFLPHHLLGVIMIGMSLLSAARIKLPISILQSNQLPFEITQTRRKKRSQIT